MAVPTTVSLLPVWAVSLRRLLLLEREAGQAEPAGLAAPFPGQTACRKRGPQNKQTIKGGMKVSELVPSAKQNNRAEN